MEAKSQDPLTELEQGRSGPQWSSYLVRGVVLGLLAFAPWAFGSVEPWARLVLFAGFATALAIWLAQLVRRTWTNLDLPLAAVPMVLGLILCLGQTIPLSKSILALLAPGTSRLREQIVPASPEVLVVGDEPVSARLPEPTISLYPSATRSVLFELSLYLAAFLLGFRYFHRREPQLWLCGVATAVGGAIALFGMIQKFSGTEQLYWTVELSQGGGPFGPFVNRNNTGGFLNLCLAASLGLLLYVTKPRHPGRTAQRRPDPSSSLTARIAASLADHLPELANLTAVRLGLFAVTGLIVAAVLCTLSRGAFLAMTGGAAVTLLAVLATRRSGGAGIFISLGMAGMLLLAWVGMTETVQRRLATILPDPEGKPHELIPHWKDALSAVPDFWLLGSGLGTYRFAYRPYERERSEVVFYHAENLYVESLLESGVVGLVLVIAAWALVAAAAWNVTRMSDRTRGSPLAFAGIFLVASQAIHSTTDFGLYIPANALWFAVLCGSLVGCAAFNRRTEAARVSRSAPPGLAAVLLPAGAAGLLLLTLLGVLDTRNSIASARALRACRLVQKHVKQAGMSPGEKIERTIAELAQALPSAWSDAEIHQFLAEFYVTRYRLEAGEAWGSPASTPPGLPRDSVADTKTSDQRTVQRNDVPEVGSVHDPLLLTARLEHLPDSEREAARRSLEAHPAVQRSLLPAVRHALWAREFCPLLPRVEMRLAELRFLLRSGDSDAVYLDRARLLAGPDAGLWFGAGLLDWYADRPDAAYRSWRRSLELSDRYLDPILAWSASRLAPAEIPTRVLPEKPTALLAAARYLYPSDDAVAERRELFEKALNLLAAQTEPLTGEELHAKIQLLRQLGRKELALEVCQATLAEQPRLADCRFELADMLFQQGKLEQSLWQLEIVLDQSPAHTGASELSQVVRRKIAEEGQRRPEKRQGASNPR